MCTPRSRSIIYNSQTWKPPKRPSTEEWVKKVWIYVYSGILLSTESVKLGHLQHTDGPRDYHTE